VGDQIEKEFKVDNKSDKSSWAIGGTTLIGVGVGFIFLKTSVLFFVAFILIGIGAGLVITSFLSRVKE
jgi:F0F1-type ATP synthase assembly protein I